MNVKITTYIPPNSDQTSEKFVNYIMLDGKKTIARKIFADMLSEIEKRGNKNPKEIFFRGIENAKPSMEVRPKRVGGSIYQVPFEVSPKRQQMLAFRWILTAARDKKNGPMARRLAQEILEAAEGTGTAVKKKEDVHRMAAANRAFAHYSRYK
ncbi:30S ribosomal protein S7 [Patescibacteria group bacterium]|nr:30S ribosomal protein S7 [Patescibacteria group bacterium]